MTSKITDSIQIKLDKLTTNYQTIEASMGQADIIADHNKYQQLAKEFSQLNPIINTYKQLKHLQQQVIELEQVAASETGELKELALEELIDIQANIQTTETELCILLLPKDPDDKCNTFVEIRAGTGGLEASLFVADLFRMYTRYAELKQWQVKVISSHESESGGFKEIIIHIQGSAVYEVLKYESGTHRVQRIPATESQGRIHTSACTVAVMPEIEVSTTVEISPNDIRIDTYRASGAGGQHVNKTDSAVRITHLPTNTVVECQDERSQHKNKAKALNLLSTKIASAEKAKQKAEEAATRKLLVGSGDRSERIRTYNFPQGRLTDHRINLTLYALNEIIEGNLDQVLIPLRQQDQLNQMAEFK